MPLSCASPAAGFCSGTPGARRFTDGRPRKSLGQVTHTLFQTGFPVSLEEVESALDRGGRWDGELRHTRRDGARIAVESRHILVRAPDETPVAVLETNRDITLRKEAEEAVGALNTKLGAANKELELRNREVERANRMKSEFLASMSHELRTPLNAIIGFSDLLAEQTAGALSSKQQRFVNHIQQGARHLLALINDILDLSKVEAGRLELNRENVSVGRGPGRCADRHPGRRRGQEYRRPQQHWTGCDGLRGPHPLQANLVEPAEQRGQVHARRRQDLGGGHRTPRPADGFG
jgi:signal transduction histidine kinase